MKPDEIALEEESVTTQTASAIALLDPMGPNANIKLFLVKY